MRRILALAILLFFTVLQQVYAQTEIGLVLRKGQAKLTIPFSLVNNLIIIPVTLNNRLTLKFILDTGANNVILTDKLFGDIMGLKYDRTMTISGPGIIDSVSTYVANDVTIALSNGVRGRHISMLVLEEDYIQLKKNLGEDIFGIIGYDLFSRFIVEIDYDNLEVTLYDPNKFRAPKGFDIYQMDVENTKPYIQSIAYQGNAVDTMRLMIDTGASHSLLLDMDESKVLTRPDSTLETSLGHGLGGEIPGKIGRLKELRIGHYQLHNILVSIPDSGAYSNAIKRGSRHGTIGGSTLSRFNPIFDYQGGKFYLRKSRHFKGPFKYDMSGVRISYFEGPQRLEVTAITADSPASEIGIQVGDVIRQVEGRNIYNSKLSEIYSVLKSRPGRLIKMDIRRNGEKLLFKFRLRHLI